MRLIRVSFSKFHRLSCANLVDLVYRSPQCHSLSSAGYISSLWSRILLCSLFSRVSTIKQEIVRILSQDSFSGATVIASRHLRVSTMPHTKTHWTDIEQCCSHFSRFYLIQRRYGSCKYLSDSSSSSVIYYVFCDWKAFEGFGSFCPESCFGRSKLKAKRFFFLFFRVQAAKATQATLRLCRATVTTTMTSRARHAKDKKRARLFMTRQWKIRDRRSVACGNRSSALFIKACLYVRAQQHSRIARGRFPGGFLFQALMLCVSDKSWANFGRYFPRVIHARITREDRSELFRPGFLKRSLGAKSRGLH